MRWLSWLLLTLCSFVWAQERQVIPLRYEVSWDEEELWGILLGVSIPARPTEPKSVKLPSVSDASFFVAKFADGNRLFAVAKKRNKFILYADTNGNNSLTDERPFEMRQRANKMVAGPIPMLINLGDKKVTRHVGVMFLEIKGKRVPRRSSLFLTAASRWTGGLNWEGKPTPVTVLDRNCDGVITEDDLLILGSWTTQGKQLILSHELMELIVTGRYGGQRFPAKVQAGIDGKFFRFDVSPDGEKLTFEPLKVQAATVQFNGERISLMVEGSSGKWLLEGQGGQLIAPVGDFQTLSVRLARKDKRGRIWLVSANAFGPAAPRFSVPISGTTFDIEPLKLTLHYGQRGDQCEFWLDIKTANGMKVDNLVTSSGSPPEPKLRLSSPEGKVIAEPKFHYG
ncbi:MAG: hypothetical protein RMK89_10480 [Armatimonadota bacterium]|nr:hypothetical protein [Armatimonadota bacterium]MDW8143875.1 hypothetical protein [Armatimonadota bacterium]